MKHVNPQQRIKLADIQIYEQMGKQKQNDKISEIQSEGQQQKYSSLNQIRNYLSFMYGHYLIQRNQRSPISHSSILQKTHQQEQIKNTIAQIFNKLNELQKNQLYSQQIHTITHKTKKQKETKFKQLIKSYETIQEIYRQNLYQKLTKSKRFSIVQTFSSRLVIHNLVATENYQIVKLEVQLMNFKTWIVLLNQVEDSPLHKYAFISGFGAFGNVYFVGLNDFLEESGMHNNQKQPNFSTQMSDKFSQKQKQKQTPTTPFDNIAIKCIQLKRPQQLDQPKSFQQYSSKLNKVLSQYFFLLLLSQLQIGPYVSQIKGFDLILYENCVQFGVEKCSNKVQIESFDKIREDLLALHHLNIVHRDIKNQNIMYSERFKKNVFIDFGVTEFVEESIFQKTKAKFAGTLLYCNQQVQALLKKGSSFVNLYTNDVYGLNKSKQMHKQTIQIKQKLNNQPNQINYTPIINQSPCGQDKSNMQQLYHFYLVYQIKYLLFSQKYKQANQLIDLINKKISYYQSDKLQYIQSKILNFLSDLSPNKQMKTIYQSNFQQRTKSLQQFSFLSQIYSEQTYEIKWHFKQNSQKHKRYFHILRLFKYIQIYNEYDIKQSQKQIQQILISKETTQAYLNAHLSVESNNQQKVKYETQTFQDIIKNFIICANYCCLSIRTYQGLNINKKINIAKKVIEKILSSQKQYQKQCNLTLLKEVKFKCCNKQLIPLALFYQFFAFSIWRYLTQRHRFYFMVVCMSSLYLLGFPIEESNYRKWLRLNFINSQCVRQSYLQKMILTWQFTMVGTSYKSLFYKRNNKQFDQTIIQFYSKQQQQQQIKYQVLYKDQNQGQSQNNFWVLNQELFDIFLYSSHNQEKLLQMIEQIKQIKVQHINFKSATNMYQRHYLHKWKRYVCNMLKLVVIQCSLVRVERELEYVLKILLKEQNKIQNSTKKVLLQFDEEILFSSVYFSQLYKQVLISNKFSYIFQRIDKQIDYPQLSYRFYMNQRLLIQIRDKNVSKIQLLLKIVVKQFQDDQQQNFSQKQNIICLQILFRNLYHTFLYELHQLPVLNSVLFEMFIALQPIVLLGFKRSSKSSKIIDFKAAKNQIVQIQAQSIKQNKNFNTKDEKIRQTLQKIDASNRFNSTLSYIISFVQLYFKLEEYSKSWKNIKDLDFLNNYNDGTELFKISKKTHQNQLTLISQKFNHNFQQDCLNYIKNDKELKEYFLEQKSLLTQLISQYYYKKQLAQEFVNDSLIILNFYASFKAEDYNKDEIDLSKEIPPLFIALKFFDERLMRSNYQIQLCKQYIQLCKICINKNHELILMKKHGTSRVLFNCYIYSNKSFQQIQDFFLNMAYLLGKYPMQSNLKTFCISFGFFLNCMCERCFPKSPGLWKPIQFIEYLSINFSKYNVYQHPYMSLVFFYSFKRNELPLQTGRKFIKFIFSSFNFISQAACKEIKTKIYMIYYRYYKSSFSQCYFSMAPKLKIDQIFQIQLRRIKQQQEQESADQRDLKRSSKQKKINKLTYFYGLAKRYSQFKVNELESVIEQRFIRQKLGLIRKIPQFYKTLIKNKLRRFYKVKQNYNSEQKTLVRQFQFYKVPKNCSKNKLT